MTTSAMNEFSGPWTKQKLEILTEYLSRYTTVLKNQKFQLTYVDAFAGTGYINVNSPDARQSSPLLQDAVDDDAASVLKGSTQRALAVDNRPFDHFVFVEQNSAYAGGYAVCKPNSLTAIFALNAPTQTNFYRNGANPKTDAASHGRTTAPSFSSTRLLPKLTGRPSSASPKPSQWICGYCFRFPH